jgi:hypothetical protein
MQLAAHTFCLRIALETSRCSTRAWWQPASSAQAPTTSFAIHDLHTAQLAQAAGGNAPPLIWLDLLVATGPAAHLVCQAHLIFLISILIGRLLIGRLLALLSCRSQLVLDALLALHDCAYVWVGGGEKASGHKKQRKYGDAVM